MSESGSSMLAKYSFVGLFNGNADWVPKSKRFWEGACRHEGKLTLLLAAAGHANPGEICG